MGSALRLTCAAVLLATASPAVAAGQERYAVGGEHIAVYNLAGEVQVVSTAGGQVTVEVFRGGRDADQLRVEVGRLDDRNTLRVIYPADRVVYSGRRWSGTTQLRVRADGTWGGEGQRGDLVRIMGRGRGLDAHADLRVGVPRGQEVDLYVGVGRITAENVEGRIRLDARSGPVEARDVVGPLTIRTGSGGIRVGGLDGSLVARTGSGRVHAEDVAGDSVAIQTGSGRITGGAIHAHGLRARSGSGSIDLKQSSGREVHLNTGSGPVTAELMDRVDHLQVRTGSGGVRLSLAPGLDAEVVLSTGSGRIQLDYPMLVTRQDRRELRGTIGQGAGAIRVTTGSGSIRLDRL